MYGVYACGVFQTLGTSVLKKTGEIEGPSHNIQYMRPYYLLMSMHGYRMQNNST